MDAYAPYERDVWTLHNWYPTHRYLDSVTTTRHAKRFMGMLY